MIKKQIFGVLYVSIWVIIWGTFGSFVDLPFLKAEIYSEGSLGQLTTFTITAIASAGLAVLVYPKILSLEFIFNALDLNPTSKN